ncbi:SPOR domain-containing protein [Dysgonomonas sp. Marseille-P4361]|uniref:SPOR domain-containing protein n=1 Tax=Dysgonomonas sp. Marseille-P4361 TaxID=2161820 RepID=UPI000D551ACF|nr:hypothetical protein [Dysgonomonas sp. Marseille-P4361]
MKIYFYTTLLFCGFLVLSGNTYSQENTKVLKVNSQQTLTQEGVISHDVSFDKEVVEELDSLLRNGVGLSRVKTENGQSILKMELDPSSKSSLSMFGYMDVGYRYSNVGKAKPDPRIASIKTNRKRRSIEDDKDPIAIAIASNLVNESSSKSSETPRTSTQLSSELNTPKVSPKQEYKDAANRQFRTMDVSVIDSGDKQFLKQYSIVLGAFRSQNNADFIRRTFNALGEKVFVARTTTGIYYALLLGADTEAEVVKIYDDFSSKYTEGISRPKRISRYGIPLDDMWILIK